MLAGALGLPTLRCPNTGAERYRNRHRDAANGIRAANPTGGDDPRWRHGERQFRSTALVSIRPLLGFGA
jgi:hypothetical protein